MNLDNYKIIGTGKTKIYSNDENRTHNLFQASNSINNYIVGPAEIFSFNKTLGERTEENGYKLAESIDNKKIVKTIGGGIGQVSTTLNKAVKDAKLEVIEAHKHSKSVDYSKPEDEAAVVYGQLDYRFKNNRSKPVKIVSKVDIDNMEVIVKIYEKV